MTALSAASSEPLVTLAGVTCSYGGIPALRDVDLVIGSTQFTGVVGPSGSGKTSLLRVLLGSLRPDRGVVDRRPDVRIGYVPQVEQVDWSFPITVDECVLMARTAVPADGGRRRRVPWPSRRERAEAHEVLSRLGIEGLGRRHIRELSGGQQQRVFIARALLGRPDLLLLDEPTSGVDVHTRHEVLHLLDDLHRDGLAIVLTTHDLNGIASHLPDLVCLHGEVIGQGPPADVLTLDVLEATFGARMSILEHAGMTIIVDDYEHRHDDLDDLGAPIPAPLR